jgi:hypothetical protein
VFTASGTSVSTYSPARFYNPLDSPPPPPHGFTLEGSEDSRAHLGSHCWALGGGGDGAVGVVDLPADLPRSPLPTNLGRSCWQITGSLLKHTIHTASHGVILGTRRHCNAKHTTGQSRLEVRWMPAGQWIKSYKNKIPMFLWCVKPCGHHLNSWRWRRYISPKPWYIHGVRTQKNNIVIFIAVRISNLKQNRIFFREISGFNAMSMKSAEPKRQPKRNVRISGIRTQAYIYAPFTLWWKNKEVLRSFRTKWGSVSQKYFNNHFPKSKRCRPGEGSIWQRARTALRTNTCERSS